MPRRACGARDQQSARRVLVEAMDELGPAALVADAVEQAIEMLGRLSPALSRKSRRLVEDESVGVFVDDHVTNELHLVLGQHLARALRPCRPRRSCSGRWNANFLPGLDAIARPGPLAVDAQLAGPGPAR